MPLGRLPGNCTEALLDCLLTRIVRPRSPEGRKGRFKLAANPELPVILFRHCAGRGLRRCWFSFPGAMPQPLAATLTHLRVGNQTFLINFYQEHRDSFAAWARQQHQLESSAAHELLRSVLVEFYDQVADGRLTKLPTDVLEHVHNMATQQLEPKATTTGALPVAEASRRHQLLHQFAHLGADCQQVLMFFYFRGYNFKKLAGKMGFANATVGRLQKSGCLRRLYDLHLRSES